jgi:hypothetical protein
MLKKLLQELREFAEGKRLTDQSTILSLWKRDWINVSETTSFDTPEGQREYLAVSITERGQRALISFAN